MDLDIFRAGRRYEFALSHSHFLNAAADALQPDRDLHPGRPQRLISRVSRAIAQPARIESVTGVGRRR